MNSRRPSLCARIFFAACTRSGRYERLSSTAGPWNGTRAGAKKSELCFISTFSAIRGLRPSRSFETVRHEGRSRSLLVSPGTVSLLGILHAILQAGRKSRECLRYGKLAVLLGSKRHLLG